MTTPMSSLATIESPPERDSLPPGFRELYAEHYDFLWRCALRLGAGSADVEDLIQETFVIALRRYDPETFVGRAQPSTWLFAILHNVLRNHARGERRRRARHDRIAEISDSRSPDHADTQLGLRLLDEFLTELDPDQRSVFVLAELEGLRGPEIARVLGLNANTARSRLRLARRAFRARFEDERERLVEDAGRASAPEVARARTLASLAMPAGKWWAWGSVGAWIGARGLIGVGLSLVLGLGAGLVLHAQRSSSDRAQAPRSASNDSPPPRVARSSDAEPIEAAPIEAPPSEPAAIVVVAPSPSIAPQPTRTSEVEDPTRAALSTLARARDALAKGDGEACLALLDAATWPASLEPRKVALELGAMCSLGQVDRAHEHARAWQAAHSSANTAIDLRVPCADNTPNEHGHSASNQPNALGEERE